MKRSLPYLIIAVLVAALFFSVSRCSLNKQRGDANATALTDTVTHFKNRLGTLTASTATLQLDNKQAKNLLLKKDAALAALAKEFAALHSVTAYKTITRIDTVQVNYKDTVPCVYERAGIIKDTWYRFTYSSNQKGFTIDSLTLPNKTTVITGFKRSWFLGRQTLMTDITNTNPYITVTGIAAAQISLPVPWYKKWYVWLAAGAAAGFVMVK